MSPEESNLFLNFAVIGGALLGLAFVTLSFFFVDLLTRYDRTALPVFRDRDRHIAAPTLPRPYSLTDFQLFDGDPVVIFVAASVAVTWLFFLIPLAVGLTVAWAGAQFATLAVELFLLVGFLSGSFLARNWQIERLRPYATREEKIWPLLGWLMLIAYWSATAAIIFEALAKCFPSIPKWWIWSLWRFPTEHDSIFLLKLICVGSLLLGTYTINKDMFVFFRTFATERMRDRWLRMFLKDFDVLEAEVLLALSFIPHELQPFDPLFIKWNGGVPPLNSLHSAFHDEHKDDLYILWAQLRRTRKGVATWMIDVPSIAQWAEELRQALRGRAPLV
jgi:hypothetical protein